MRTMLKKQNYVMNCELSWICKLDDVFIELSNFKNILFFCNFAKVISIIVFTPFVSKSITIRYNICSKKVFWVVVKNKQWQKVSFGDYCTLTLNVIFSFQKLFFRHETLNGTWIICLLFCLRYYVFLIHVSRKFHSILLYDLFH